MRALLKNAVRRINNENGFTLMEVIISIAVLSISSIYIFNMLITAANANLRAKNVDIALTECAAAIESFKAGEKPSGDFTGDSLTTLYTQYFSDDWRVVENVDSARFALTFECVEERPDGPLAVESENALFLITVRCEDLTRDDEKRVLAELNGAKYFVDFSTRGGL